LAFWKPIFSANSYLYREKVKYKNMFVHNYADAFTDGVFENIKLVVLCRRWRLTMLTSSTMVEVLRYRKTFKRDDSYRFVGPFLVLYK
jgi:hypothetical protein